MSRPSPSAPGTRNNAVLVTVLVLVALVGGFFVWRALTPAAAAGGGIDVTGQPVLGPADAKVTVVVFEDFKCPNCKRYDAEFYPQIKSNYIDTGKIRYAFVNFPFLGPDSTTAAMAGECVRAQNADLFWPFKDIVYRGQGEETQEWATIARLVEFGGYVSGVDTAKLRSCIEGNEQQAALDRDAALVRERGVNSTPSVFVNGVRAQDYTFATVKSAIDKALAGGS